MILLDVAGYGLFDNADAFLVTAGKVLATGAGLLIGGFFLLIILLAAIAGIGLVSVRRGMRYRSVPRTVGTFFRWGGVAVGAFFALLIIPVVALWFHVSAWYLLAGFAVLLALGYVVGRTISKLIGLRMQGYATSLRMADSIGSRIMRIVNGM
jgi:hypothetical protein